MVNIKTCKLISTLVRGNPKLIPSLLRTMVDASSGSDKLRHTHLSSAMSILTVSRRTLSYSYMGVPHIYPGGLLLKYSHR